jgi:CRP/FNR family transcriptional regulator
MSGWSFGLQTLIVAHNWREESTEPAARALTGCPPAASAETGASRAASADAAAKGLLADRLPYIKVKIAPDLAPRWRFAAVWYSVSMAATRASEVVELLGRVPVFSTLEQADLERIAQLAVPRHFEPGQAVFREGDQSDTCYIVREGHARAIRTHGDGRTITLANFGPGDIFGELAMFEDERRSATVEAIEPISVVAVLGPDMRRLMIEHPEISTRLVIALGRRLRETNERLSRQSFQTVQSRVAVVLGELVAQELADGAAPKDVLVKATQADLAQLAGSSRESASRFLAVLERAGVISQGRGRLVVHEPEALGKYVF